MTEAFMEWLGALFGALDYTTIFWLMAMESSLFPVPSEAVMIPAGHLVNTGQLGFWPTLAAGTFGSLFGASANYLLGMSVGKAFLLRYGRYFLINERKYHEAEALFLHNANRATFIGRLIPVIRHLISLPAGVFRMHYGMFALLTCLGAGLWCGVLIAVGYYFGEPALAIARQYSHWLGLVAVAGLALGVAWFLFKRNGAKEAV